MLLNKISTKKKLNYRGSIFDVMFAMQAWNFIWENSICVIYNREVLNNLDIFEGNSSDITTFQNILSNIKSFCMASVSSDQEIYIRYGHTFSNAITGEKINQDSVEIIYETLEHYEEALKNNTVIQQIKSVRDDLKDFASPYDDILDGTSIDYPHMVYRDGKHYDVRYTKQNNDINVELIECASEKDKPFLVFFDDIITGIEKTVHPELNLNAATINFKSTTDFEEMRLDDVNKFIYKYDSENDIFYSLIATTNNENIPEELRYSMIVYVNYSASGGLPDGSVPYDVWYSENDDNGFDTYSFNFEFNDNVNDFTDYISNANVWSDANEEGESFSYVFTSADKKGYKFIKDSVGMITYEPFDFSTTKEYIAATSFIKKDDYSLYKKFVDKVPQIKIEGQDPNGESLILLDGEGKPSFITISELKTKLGIS